ncbi:MAG: citramalate synthase [Planctomycetia bacterium]|jgi:2-isopropylmalate synthase
MKRIEIYDTTLRDGTQAEGIAFSLQDKLLLTERLDEIGVDYIEGGYPGSNEKDFNFFQEVAKLNLASAKICAFGMTRRKGVKAVDDVGLRALLDSQAPVITLVGKSSAFQVKEVIRADLNENLDMIADSVQFMVAEGREVIFDAEHFFDGWKDDPEYAIRVLQTAAEAGAKTLVLCDTNGGSMPCEISKSMADVVAKCSMSIGIHCHNDCDLAVANAMIAVEAGATHVQGTINGFGERCGNTDLVSIIGNLGVKCDGYEVFSPEKIVHLTELSRFFYETANVNIRTNQPFVGSSAFAHKGGMHVSAIARNTASYEHISPELVGNERRILVSELSGRSNIKQLTSKHDLQDDKELMDKILEKVVALENVGYQFEAAEASFDMLVQRCAGTFQKHFERIRWHVDVGVDESGQTITEATIKIRVGEKVYHEVAEGDGPVNALDAALRKALSNDYPQLNKMHLVDYKVRVINSEAATAAGVRVIIESQDESELWGTVGVNENIIEASWIALIDSFEYKLCKDEKRLSS